MTFVPRCRVALPDQVVVPDAVFHPVPSVLNSTLWTATLSEAVPLRVTVVELRTVLFDGELIATDGAYESRDGIRVAATSADFDPAPNAATAPPCYKYGLRL